VVICHHDGGHARFPSKLRRLITSPTPCGVIYPVAALELWAVRFLWLMKLWEHATPCKWDS
jgi:hypothetical protein